MMRELYQFALPTDTKKGPFVGGLVIGNAAGFAGDRATIKSTVKHFALPAQVSTLGAVDL